MPIIKELENCAVSIEGKTLEKWMHNDSEWTKQFLENQMITKIYSRSSPFHK